MLGEMLLGLGETTVSEMFLVLPAAMLWPCLDQDCASVASALLWDLSVALLPALPFTLAKFLDLIVCV